MKLSGKCSQFGGKDDPGMINDSGLAFFEAKEADARKDLFYSDDPSVPTWKRLKTESFYIALNLPYGVDRKWAQASHWRILNKKNDSVIASVVDRGPGAAHRVVDCSPGIMRALGLKTDDIVTVEEIYG